jgi:threonyl-tRNA synthetase
LGRVWQCGTIQVDFSMPGRLKASYIDEEGEKQTPVMLHRAILGSLERFVGILIEHYAAHFPLWLAPVQCVVTPITDRQADQVEILSDYLKKQGFRIESDLRNEKIGFKIRDHALQKIPYVLIIGDREAENQTVSVRYRGKELGNLTVDQLVTRLTEENFPQIN